MTANKIKVSCLDCLSTHEVENKNNQELCIYCKCGAKLQIIFTDKGLQVRPGATR